MGCVSWYQASFYLHTSDRVVSPFCLVLFGRFGCRLLSSAFDFKVVCCIYLIECMDGLRVEQQWRLCDFMAGFFWRFVFELCTDRGIGVESVFLASCASGRISRGWVDRGKSRCTNRFEVFPITLFPRFL